MKYRVGKAQDPRENDPTFDDWSTALSAALDMSDADTLDSFVIAIWEDDGYGTIVALVFQSGAYTP